MATKKKTTAAVSDENLAGMVTDDHNANKGTVRGRGMLAKSIAELGAGRSIVIDAKGKIVAGNKSAEAFVEAGMTDAIVVDSDGSRPIVVRRTDWNLDDRKGPARRYAYLDNRVADVDLAWDTDVVAADVADGLDLGDMFDDGELATITMKVLHAGTDADAEWQGMPAYEDQEPCHRKIVVSFDTPEAVAAFFKLITQTYTDKTKSVWFPPKENRDLKAQEWKPEQ